MGAASNHRGIFKNSLPFSIGAFTQKQLIKSEERGGRGGLEMTAGAPVPFQRLFFFLLR